MSSTFGGLNTVVRGLFAQQISLDTVGHNISNANTEGFSRQRVNLATVNPQTVYTGNGQVQLGIGVATQSITRARDTFVDQQMWKETSTLGYGQTIQDTLGKIEGVFQEPTATGMQTVLNNFWKAWNTLSTNGSDNGARTALRERAVELVDSIQQANTQLRDMVSDINTVIGIRVDKINQITSEMLSLNKQITSIEVGKLDHANDLRDRRDYLVDQLSQMINVRVSEDQVGNYVVQSSGLVLVDGNDINKLKVESRKDPDYGYEVVDVKDVASGVVINFTNGEVKGLLDARDKTVANSSGEARESDIGVKAYLNKLATMSQFLLQEFNAVHRTGFGTDNSTGNNFFGKGGDADPDYSASDLTSIFGVAAAKDVPPSEWIKALQVNSDLFNTTSGVSRIAAKTFADNVTIQQSNSAAGKAAVGLYSGYTGGTGYKAYNVELGTVDATGKVQTINYSVDGGAVVSATLDPDGSFHLSNGVKISIETNTNNTSTNTYSFTVPQGNAAGDNAINMANRLKVDSSDLLGKSSLDTFYSSFIGALGVQTQNAKRLTDNQETLVKQITNWRESVSGVNIDEEMSNMIRFQKGYNAAARILTTMDEMLDKLINGTGTVGR
ncbi:flagellar hook-associated protein FlgK [Sporomusa sp.]|uniref:flagellar hook-associated protein FlgK n=1 Tax=Sporomusa sp. TaxID=2078658 RepID=UPI002CE70464|nr:flagellar hook-associated protein FlgK [Sporomusa sp.]HWR45789.1 flagellar hook-associated protein FlgK [Sporomusa sp.]